MLTLRKTMKNLKYVQNKMYDFKEKLAKNLKFKPKLTKCALC